MHTPILFSHQDVRTIVASQEARGTEQLKANVVEVVRKRTGIHGQLPERIKTWVHQLCMHITADIGEPVFTGKLSQPIDLSSLPTTQRSLPKS